MGAMFIGVDEWHCTKVPALSAESNHADEMLNENSSHEIRGTA